MRGGREGDLCVRNQPSSSPSARAARLGSAWLGSALLSSPCLNTLAGEQAEANSSTRCHHVLSQSVCLRLPGSNQLWQIKYLWRVLRHLVWLAGWLLTAQQIAWLRGQLLFQAVMCDFAVSHRLHFCRLFFLLLLFIPYSPGSRSEFQEISLHFYLLNKNYTKRSYNSVHFASWLLGFGFQMTIEINSIISAIGDVFQLDWSDCSIVWSNHASCSASCLCVQWCSLRTLPYPCMTAKVAPSNGTDVPCHLPSGRFLILGAFLLFFFFLPPPLRGNLTGGTLLYREPGHRSYCVYLAI